MFHTVNTRLLGVIVSLSLSLITLAGFLIYLLIVNRSTLPNINSTNSITNGNKLIGYNNNELYGETIPSSSSSSSPTTYPYHSYHHQHYPHHHHHSSSSPSSSSSVTNFLSSSPTSPLYDETDLRSVSPVCSSMCPEKTYKDYLCDVKFVMLVNITKLLETYETTNGTITRVYSISIKKTYKKSLLFIIAFRTQRITVTSTKGCPSSQEPLSPGHLYFVTGRVKGLTALVDQCDLTIDWTTVNESIKEEIRSFFSSVIGSCSNYPNP